MPAATTERVHLSVAAARALSERAMRGIGYEPEEARILADHVIDAALCGYEYSGLPKLLNVADHPRFKARLALPPADVELPNTEWVSNHHCCVPIYYLRG